MIYRDVVIDESVLLSLGKYFDDPSGLRRVLDAVDSLAGDPSPTDSVPWGQGISRLHIGPYRVMYEVNEAVVRVRRIDRVR